MAGICCGLVNKSETSTACEQSSRAARRRRMEIRRFKFVTGVATPEPESSSTEQKRQKLEGYYTAPFSSTDDEKKEVVVVENERLEIKEISSSNDGCASTSVSSEYPKFGVASVCGRRRDMEDAVAIHPSFSSHDHNSTTKLHYFGVYDGHGCSHVATKCREKLHELVKEELLLLETQEEEWKGVMERSFYRMDKEVNAWNETVLGAKCRCELQSPECDAVGSTAVVAIVTPNKIIVANCGDSRAVLCRNGKTVPLSSDHKPDRPDELNRIQAAGGRVIYWDGPRVLGVLAMSRAIGDNYLKPYVSCEPEVTITDRTAEDDCLILASDGLWDVVSNETACGVARMCLRGKAHSPPCSPPGAEVAVSETSDKACSDAAMLLTKLALARHSTDNVSVVVVNLRRDT
uniref:protein-serine/threonine phosphatase n=1 Tax=Quercus lobata TaxID=97700 RepID=A0A7N2KNV1_QUELO